MREETPRKIASNRFPAKKLCVQKQKLMNRWGRRNSGTVESVRAGMQVFVSPKKELKRGEGERYPSRRVCSRVQQDREVLLTRYVSNPSTLLLQEGRIFLGIKCGVREVNPGRVRREISRWNATARSWFYCILARWSAPGSCPRYYAKFEVVPGRGALDSTQQCWKRQPR